MTLQELKAYTDALIEETGDERLKRVRAKMDEVMPQYPPVFQPPLTPNPTYSVPPVVPPWSVTCGSAALETVPNIQVQN